VSVGELTGQDLEQDRAHPGIAALRQALVSASALSGAGKEEDGEAPPLAVLQGRLAAARRAYWKGDFDALEPMLPELLHNARAVARDSPEGMAPLALTRDMVAALLVHYGLDDLASIAAERAVRAALYSGDGLLEANGWPMPCSRFSTRKRSTGWPPSSSRNPGSAPCAPKTARSSWKPRPRALVAQWVLASRGLLGSAENYVEIAMEFPDRARGERYAFTVQRVGKLTPHQARQQAEAERDRARAELEAARA
jgi:hypothetical protein